MNTELTRIKLAWLTHAGRMARRGNVRGYAQALRILRELEGPLLVRKEGGT